MMGWTSHPVKKVFISVIAQKEVFSWGWGVEVLKCVVPSMIL